MLLARTDRSMRELDIVLTEAELLLLNQITFKPVRGEFNASVDAISNLTNSLLARGGIPDVRLDYFTKSECNPGGRGKSWEDIFIANGNEVDEIQRHPSFLKFLEYFLYGPNLPPHVIKKFKDEMLGSGYLTAGDVNDLTPYARKIVREDRLEPHQAAEEFHKLVLECGGQPYAAESIRKSVMAVKVFR
jgi:hypothetical protein